ncbi:MAG: DUF4062 domain-containing protein [Promethearchaeota archaeon]
MIITRKIDECKECGEKFNDIILERYMKGDIVICENCGAENRINKKIFLSYTKDSDNLIKDLQKKLISIGYKPVDPKEQFDIIIADAIVNGFIFKEIDDCFFFVHIIDKSYGLILEGDDKSFFEREFNYAYEKNKNILIFARNEVLSQFDYYKNVYKNDEFDAFKFSAEQDIYEYLIRLEKLGLYDYILNFNTVDDIIDEIKTRFGDIISMIKRISAPITSKTIKKITKKERIKAPKIKPYRNKKTRDIKISPKTVLKEPPKIEPDKKEGSILKFLKKMHTAVKRIETPFYSERRKKAKLAEKEQLKKITEKLIFDGDMAFKNRDFSTGIEKYKQGIENYKKLHEIKYVFELLANLIEQCILAEQSRLGENFAEELFKLAVSYKNMFYKAEASYFLGSFLLKKVKKENLEQSLNLLKNAGEIFKNIKDFVGVGKCMYKIGLAHQIRLNEPHHAAFFYVQAIKGYNYALIHPHPKRKTPKDSKDALIKEIIELKDVVINLIPKIKNVEYRKNIKSELNSIKYNF